jgi:hypothetical protein
VAAAAEALGYTPPAVSQHVSKLEADLGTALFDRSAGRLVLSEAGPPATTFSVFLPGLPTPPPTGDAETFAIG